MKQLIVLLVGLLLSTYSVAQDGNNNEDKRMKRIQFHQSTSETIPESESYVIGALQEETEQSSIYSYRTEEGTNIVVRGRSHAWVNRDYKHPYSPYLDKSRAIAEPADVIVRLDR